MLLTTIPLATTASSLEPLLDRDFKPEGSDVEMSPFASGPLTREGILTTPITSTSTYEDFKSANRIPPIDYSSILKSYLTTFLLIATPLSIFSAVTILSFRNSPRITLPVQYDVPALQRYFSLRPDVVLRRLIQFAGEGTSVIYSLLMDVAAVKVDQHILRKTSEEVAARELVRAKKRAVQLRDGITRLGPAMIKLGQAAASRPDLLSSEMVRELQPLQDEILSKFPSTEAFEVIEKQLNSSVSLLFDRIEHEPVAGASLGMVFKATIDDVDVAVKVQRPEVAISVALDCHIIRTFASIVSRVFDLRTDWTGAVDDYASRLFEELDYENELRNLQKFRRLYKNVSGIYLPKAFPKLCSRRILVTEWVDGVKLIDDNANVRHQDLGLVEVGIRFALEQLLDKGFLHADMHNGNMLRTKSGYLAYIDFGLVSEVPECVRESMVCALTHLIHGEYSLLAESFSGLELMRSDDVEVALPVLAQALKEAFEPTDASESCTVNRFADFTLIGVATKLLMLGTRFPFVFKDYFLNNLRCLGMLEGLALNADPKFSVLNVVYPYITRKILSGSSSRYKKALEDLVIDCYGRMRWSRMDQLIQDVQQTTSSIISDLYRNDGIVKGGGSNGMMLVQFMMTDGGKFVRQYVVRRYLLNIEISSRKLIDRSLGRQAQLKGSFRLVNGLVDQDANEVILGLQATERELSDDEARIRTREFFKYTGLLNKFKVFVAIFPTCFIPCFKTVYAVLVYATLKLCTAVRVWVSGRGPVPQQAPREQVDVGDGDGVDGVDGGGDEEREAAVATVSTGEWSLMDSSFVRAARAAQLSRSATE